MGSVPRRRPRRRIQLACLARLKLTAAANTRSGPGLRPSTWCSSLSHRPRRPAAGLTGSTGHSLIAPPTLSAGSCSLCLSARHAPTGGIDVAGLLAVDELAQAERGVGVVVDRQPAGLTTRLETRRQQVEKDMALLASFWPGWNRPPAGPRPRDLAAAV